MSAGVRAVPRPEWSPLPYEGCTGVDGEVLVLQVERSRQGVSLCF
jgi:hypothetical protein